MGYKTGQIRYCRDQQYYQMKLLLDYTYLFKLQVGITCFGAHKYVKYLHRENGHIGEKSSTIRYVMVYLYPTFWSKGLQCSEQHINAKERYNKEYSQSMMSLFSWRPG